MNASRLTFQRLLCGCALLLGGCDLGLDLEIELDDLGPDLCFADLFRPGEDGLTGLCGDEVCEAGTANLAQGVVLDFKWVMEVEPLDEDEPAQEIKLQSDSGQVVTLSNIDLQITDVPPDEETCGARRVTVRARLKARQAGTTMLTLMEGASTLDSFIVSVNEVDTLRFDSDILAWGETYLSNATRSLDDPEPFFVRAVAFSRSGDELTLDDRSVKWSLTPTEILELGDHGDTVWLSPLSEGTSTLRADVGEATHEITLTVEGKPDAGVVDAATADGGTSGLGD